jgi:hypothetical protein
MTGRSSKSYKHRSGIGYITILWQNLGSATHVTLSGSPRRPGHLKLKLPKELESLFLAYRTIIYTIRQASGIRLLNNTAFVAAFCNWPVAIATLTTLRRPPWPSQRLLAGKRRDNLPKVNIIVLDSVLSSRITP